MAESRIIPALSAQPHDASRAFIPLFPRYPGVAMLVESPGALDGFANADAGRADDAMLRERGGEEELQRWLCEIVTIERAIDGQCAGELAGTIGERG